MPEKVTKKRKVKKSSRAKWLPRVLGVAAIGLAAFLLYWTLRKYDFDDVLSSISSIPTARLALAGLFAAASYFCLTWFDWLALQYVGRQLPYGYVALASFCSLSLGHNIGFAALSSGAIRYRFYTRCGVKLPNVARIIVFCGLTVGLGLLTLGGLVLLAESSLAGEVTGLPEHLVLLIGIACLGLVTAYLALAAFSPRRTVGFGNWKIQLPAAKLAMMQVAIGTLNFACVVACLHQVLLGLGDVPYLAVATSYVLAVASALVTHVPGGLGVLESVVLFLLDKKEFIGGVLAFRAIYFLIPLCIGGPLFALTELAQRRENSSKGFSPKPELLNRSSGI